MTAGEWVFDGHGRLVELGSGKGVQSYGPPEPTRWVSVDDLASVIGLPVADCGPEDTAYDLRAASEVYEEGGSRWVNIVHQAQWWEWIGTPIGERPEHCPRAVARRSVHVWVEVRTPAPTRVDPDA